MADPYHPSYGYLKTSSLQSSSEENHNTTRSLAYLKWQINGSSLYVPSLVAEIGEVLEKHLIDIGMLKTKELDEHQKKLVEEKKREYLDKNQDQLDESGFPKDSQLCAKCNTKAAIFMDGCLTCLNCGESKCG